jgi:hypothetical protein
MDSTPNHHHHHHHHPKEQSNNNDFKIKLKEQIIDSNTAIVISLAGSAYPFDAP